MKKREIVEAVAALVIAVAIGVLLVVVPANLERVKEIERTSTEATTEATKQTTEATTTEATTEEKTEAATRDVICVTSTAPAEVRRAKKKQEEKKTEEEESTGEVNADGYGWVQLQYSAAYHITENHLTRENGVVYFAGHRETWYSTNEAAGKATAWEIPDKHVADDGTIRDEDGYICVASSDHPRHTIIMTSVGVGKVYDTGCSHGTIDIYTTW